MINPTNEIALPREGDHVNQAGGPGATKQTEEHYSDGQSQADDTVINSRSTSTKTQITKLRALLRQGPKTTHSLRMHGISHPAGRINDLRKAGCLIVTENVKSIDSDGFTHCKTARYSMLQEVSHGE